MDPATAVVTFATAIAQVTLASVKLKRLWEQMSDIPEDVRHLIDNLEIIELLLSEMNQLQSGSGWPQDPYMARCQRLCTTAHKELETSVKELEKKLETKGRFGRKMVAARATLHRDILDSQGKRLESAMNLLFFAHQMQVHTSPHLVVIFSNILAIVHVRDI
jgi:hypothetical protein